jgi:hypothetical protein
MTNPIAERAARAVVKLLMGHLSSTRRIKQCEDLVAPIIAAEYAPLVAENAELKQTVRQIEADNQRAHKKIDEVGFENKALVECLNEALEDSGMVHSVECAKLSATECICWVSRAQKLTEGE